MLSICLICLLSYYFACGCLSSRAEFTSGQMAHVHSECAHSIKCALRLSLKATSIKSSISNHKSYSNATKSSLPSNSIMGKSTQKVLDAIGVTNALLEQLLSQRQAVSSDQPQDPYAVLRDNKPLKLKVLDSVRVAAENHLNMSATYSEQKSSDLSKAMNEVRDS